MLLSRHSEKLNLFKAISDTLCITFAWILAFIIRFNSDIISVTRGQDTLVNYLRLWPLLIFSYLFIFISTHVYSQTIEKKKVWDENFEIIKKHTIAFFIFVTLSYFIYDHRYSRLTLLIYFFILPLIFPIGRSFVRKINRIYLKFSRKKKKAIIIGNGPQAHKIKQAILTRSDWNLDLISCHSFSEVNAVDRYLKSSNVDLVFIVPNADETAHVNEVYMHLDKNLSEILLIPYLGERIFFEPKSIKIEGMLTIALNSSSLHNSGRFAKRLFDIVFASLFVIVFLPVYLICIVLVKFSSSGPVFFKQERMGLDGKRFYCYKFRGMYVNAEEKSGPVWAKADDDRTTPIGKWLRKTSLDEIPQFINVLKGEMSIVGPRPERPIFVDNFKTQIPGYMLRHKVKAGITGWAQINGWRGNTSLEKRIECDLWYIQNWSMWLDLKIVFLTPFKGLVHPNAY
ncbi:undecaprenyl-phosphate glucose phosphotransferase [Fluviispira multicolorata]|uniref:Undecaprenyl-phosphate glucose phosphotransferase n=1 Tax=Fluviispira multicolorata TaxID=2654512 RepID=A0A833JFK0_9BACT|nr:undecaprenyl-phosphate glucose phosphotransferase [Fluviispira multicolorata]KAB8033784.1 undecaprenyl-phosphate glucose phosphotransferase [Fluviispira multicolorata]